MNFIPPYTLELVKNTHGLYLKFILWNGAFRRIKVYYINVSSGCPSTFFGVATSFILFAGLVENNLNLHFIWIIFHVL